MPSPKTSPKAVQAAENNLNPAFDFPTAMRAVIDGGHVTKLEWNNPEIFVFLDGHLKIKLEDGVHDLIVSDGDMLGTDWVRI